MNDTWNEICYELKSCIFNNALEKEYEEAFVNCMRLLGWKKSKKEISTQNVIQVGHEKKYADVVALQDGIEQFVIEIKRPGHVLQPEDEKQLFSYMRLLKHQVPIGIYVGDDIRIYYDDVSTQQYPECVCSIEIVENNPAGFQFVELFSRDNFRLQHLVEFCKKQKARLDEQNQIQAEVQKILSDEKGSTFKELLKEKYTHSGYSSEWADAVLEQITLNVSPSVRNQSIEVTPKILGVSTGDRKNRDRTRYSILGGKPLPKNRFVLEVVRLFVKNNPKTYHEYVGILNPLRQDSFGTIEQLSKANETRYFMAEEDRLQSLDGVIFVVCTQWGISNIAPVIQFANEQGYNVIPFNPDK